jgi:hypothetical protein
MVPFPPEQDALDDPLDALQEPEGGNDLFGM